MRRTILLAITLAALAGCGSGARSTSHASSTVGPSSDGGSSATSSPSRTLLTGADALVCQSAVNADGDVYQLLADLESQGMISSGHEKARLDILTVGSTLSIFDGQIKDSELARALGKIEADAPEVSSAQGQQPVSPEPLKTHLVDAAVICEHGGIPISWYSSS